ncbi:helix-turn-helix domain-containing protein [Polluticoccus soli]|uniref:helix-turn-helix domain-containing protein n=1 Tax=Polluticoccus soli TaxID=3034150 RepID=UPI0023E1C87F|nr:helix-turn-helix domain-containing protein [Flavipsychrobacter sp. JY13-12]
MQVTTFDQLPRAISELFNRVNNIELLLRAKDEKTHETDEVLTIQYAAELLSLSVPTIYGLVSRKDIPYSKKGKRLYFSRLDLLDWIKSGRHKTNTEIASDADQYVSTRRRGNHA